MPRPRVYKTEAIVLKHSPLGEADRIYTLYTPTFGKLRALAKGVRRITSRKAGHLEPLTRAALLLAQGQNLDIITECKTLEAYLPLRGDLWRTSGGLYMAELTDQLTVERAENYQLYHLLARSLGWLCQTSGGGLLRFFELNLLRYLGFRPELRQCAICNGELPEGIYYFSASGGGTVCTRCQARQAIVRPLSIDALKALRLLERGDGRGVLKLQLGEELDAELEYLMRQYLWYLLERELKSTGVLDQLRHGLAQVSAP